MGLSIMLVVRFFVIVGFVVLELVVGESVSVVLIVCRFLLCV